MIALPPPVSSNFNPYLKDGQHFFSRPRRRISPASKQHITSSTDPQPQEKCLPLAVTLTDSPLCPQLRENVPPTSELQPDSSKLYIGHSQPDKRAPITDTRLCYDQASLFCAAFKKGTPHNIKRLPHPKSHFEDATPTRAKTRPSPVLRPSRLVQPEMRALTTNNGSFSPEPFPLLVGDGSCGGSSSSGCIIDNHVLPKSGSDAECNSIEYQHQNRHHQRPSNASSGNIHTMKTASMSNISFSLAPKSVRVAGSSECPDWHQTCTRHSLDSDGPFTRSPLDDAALHRALKRRDIINELIMTEESYVADLKALGYLYSTLLVSTPAISDHVRKPVLRNVTELLHIHESLLGRLHQTSFNIAARQWSRADLTPRSQIDRQTHWMNTNSRKHNETYGNHKRLRSSVDSGRVIQAYNVIDIADPADMLDFADVLRDLPNQLPVYQEYCASYRIVACELRSHGASLWSTYESGMESLNKSIVALNRRRHQHRKGLTVGDLLIKPIQRICKYPLLLADLVKHTPVIDGPAAHRALDVLSDQISELLQNVNLATDDLALHAQTRRKWLVFDRLILPKMALSNEDFRNLGSVKLCGVLHVVYQNKSSDIRGCFAVCVLCDNHLLIALPITKSSKLELLAVIAISNSDVQCATTKPGLRCLSSPYTWKLVFTADDNLYEIVLSACSEEEERQWKQGLRGLLRSKNCVQTTMDGRSRVMKDFLPLHSVSDSSTDDLQHYFESSAVNLGYSKHEACSVVIRNTFNPPDTLGFQGFAPLVVNKSQPRAGVRRAVIIAPKRSERARLEIATSDIYTKDRLPFPGIGVSMGSQIIRASAGSLARKLSFASMQASFSRRSASLSSKRSYHTIHVMPQKPPTFSVVKQSLDDRSPARNCRFKELPELDTMDSVVERMIGTGTARKRLSFSGGEKLVRKNTKSAQFRHVSYGPVGPEDPATMFYSESRGPRIAERPGQDGSFRNEASHVEEGLSGLSKRKRWSNPITKLRGIGSDGLKMMLYSSS